MASQVLVVEDNLTNQKIIKAILEALDLEVSIANNGVEAVDEVSVKQFDIILMDIQMPLMDGLEATEKIRKMGGWCAKVPIIAVTANEEYLVDSGGIIADEFSAVVPKPIDTKLLGKVVLAHLSGP